MKWTPEVVIATIQSLHRRKRPLHSSYMQRHNVTLYVASCKRFGGWPQAITAAGLDYAAVRAQPPQKVWSKDAVKEEILRRHREELTLSASEVQKEDNRLTWAATKYFGKRGWNKALTYAGLDYRDFDTRIIWSKKTVIEAILRRREQKLPLNMAALRIPELRSLRHGAEHVFGSWEAAIKAAGLDYASIRLNEGWNKKRVLKTIRSLRSIGVWLKGYYIQQNHPHLYSAARRIFSTWPIAVLVEQTLDRADGTPGRRKVMTREVVIEMIKARHRQDLPLNSGAVHSTAVYSAALRAFGGWREAIAAAGLEYKDMRLGRGQKWTRETVIETLKQMYANKEPLNSGAMGSTGIYRTAYVLFGGWKQAILAAGLDYESIRRQQWSRAKTLWTKERVLREIRELAAKFVQLRPGSYYTRGSLRAHHDNLYGAGKRLFGTWEKAVIAAGIDYSKYQDHSMRPPSVVYSSLPGNLVSLHEPVGGPDSELTREGLLGSKDPGFERVEARQVLIALLKQNHLNPQIVELLERVIAGYDLEDDEYVAVASAIREHPELMKLLETN